ncbi:sigma-70 family RNA polymerase sigma factor [Paenibacillus albidus]|uniref:sigma-70 family RNA polymerase sigma factor n=1 Tax=Paenibacillus albidus TaxID=2041023 RepID=UPI001BEC57F1|nr:sigma-70 family RNA polymerase sigma factor [Paenibacillus albidus]MBT2291941.1 sigma-70 family RNA polymerase sigma factor [Paenibacillus albidus]
MRELDITPWVEGLAAGDQEAFRRVYEATVQDVYRTVTFLLGNPRDVEDVMNEVYMKLWTSIAGYDSNRPFRHWLHGIVVRQVQDWRRKTWRRFRLFERKAMLEVERVQMAPDTSIVLHETSREMLEAIHGLSYKLRVVVILRYYHDYSLNEIAGILDIPLGTVKSRHHLALKALREHAVLLMDDKEEPYYVH